MAKLDLPAVWSDIKKYRRAYILTVVASFGGMVMSFVAVLSPALTISQLFGWDTGLIGGVLRMDAFQESFNLDPNSSDFANLQGNIVSVLQAGCFFGALASFYVNDTFGRKWALVIADIIFIIGSLIQTLCALGTKDLTQLYIGRVIGGFGVGLISAVVPTYISENAPKEIRGRCVGCMQLFNVTGICLSFFVNYGINLDITSRYNSAKWRIPFALQMLPGVLLLAGIFFQNESPRWLIEKNRITEAAKALAHVRGKSVDDPEVVQELDDIIADFNGHEKMSMAAQLKSACSSKKTFYRSSFAVILMFWQQWTGVLDPLYRIKLIALTSIRHQFDQLLCPANLPTDRSCWCICRPVRHWCLRYCEDCRYCYWSDGLHRAAWSQSKIFGQTLFITRY